MDLKPQFNRAQVQAFIAKELEKMDQFVFNELLFIGLEFVRNARINADFTDRTGNLRSSIGFLILKNGKVLKEDFEESSNGTEKGPGKAKGREFALEAVEGVTQGFVLIVVAGMQYAAAVEAKGYDVLTSSAFAAEDQLKQSLERVKRVFNT